MKKVIKYDKNALDELEKFSSKVRTSFLGLINNLSEDGRLEYPDARKITGDMFEMRVISGGAFRGFYAYVYKNLIVILHFFQKKSQKTPIKNLKIAERRLKRYV
ncbi:MAG: type II toxin-antitoxin system RelE/ParE family toxin [bacterium]